MEDEEADSEAVCNSHEQRLAAYVTEMTENSESNATEASSVSLQVPRTILASGRSSGMLESFGLDEDLSASSDVAVTSSTRGGASSTSGSSYFNTVSDLTNPTEHSLSFRDRIDYLEEELSTLQKQQSMWIHGQRHELSQGHRVGKFQLPFFRGSGALLGASLAAERE